MVHLHNFQPLAYTSVLLAGRGPSAAADFLVEYGKHGSLPRATAAGLGYYVNRAVSMLVLRCADAVVCVSRRQREILLKHLPELKSKTTVIYNPPPPLPVICKNPSRDLVFVYAGGSSYVKGFHALLKFLSRVARRGGCGSCRFYVVAGHGPERPLKVLFVALEGRLVALGAAFPLDFSRSRCRTWSWSPRSWARCPWS